MNKFLYLNLAFFSISQMSVPCHAMEYNKPRAKTTPIKKVAVETPAKDAPALSVLNTLGLNKPTQTRERAVSTPKPVATDSTFKSKPMTPFSPPKTVPTESAHKPEIKPPALSSKPEIIDSASMEQPPLEKKTSKSKAFKIPEELDRDVLLDVYKAKFIETHHPNPTVTLNETVPETLAVTLKGQSIYISHKDTERAAKRILSVLEQNEGAIATFEELRTRPISTMGNDYTSYGAKYQLFDQDSAEPLLSVVAYSNEEKEVFKKHVDTLENCAASKIEEDEQIKTFVEICFHIKK